MAAKYADHGVSFVFVYTREAHPGERYPHLTSVAQKLQHARDMVARDRLTRPMLVDDLEGTVHHAYGRLPNMAYLVGGGGRVVYRASWTDAPNIELALDLLVRQRGERRAGTVHRPYYAEWQPNVAADRQTFVELLLETVGPRAVTEYIDAVEHTMSAAVARPLRTWWAAADQVGGGEGPADDSGGAL
jgi:hypothetical protein